MTYIDGQIHTCPNCRDEPNGSAPPPLREMTMTDHDRPGDQPDDELTVAERADRDRRQTGHDWLARIRQQLKETSR